MPMHMQCPTVVVGVDGVASGGWVGGLIGGRRCRRRTVAVVSLSVPFLLVGVCIFVMRMPCEKFRPSSCEYMMHDAMVA